MKIEIHKKDTGISIKLEGRLDTTTAPQLEEVFSVNLTEQTELLLNFAALEYISSAGLRVLLTAHKKMEKQGGKMVIQGVNKEVQEVFDITGFLKILNVKG